MGRVKKIATERHTATLSPFVTDFVRQATEVPLYALPAHLSQFPQHWPLPRGDLYHWIPLLDRFDHLLELFNKEYGLDQGPQAQPFTRRLLQEGDAEQDMPYPSTGADLQELDHAGFSDEGDRELIESVLHFTRILLEHCGNRSLYASSTHLNNVLHTTSLTLLRVCLKLSLRLAQRYQVARFKNHHPGTQAALLANHYNIKLDNLQKMAMPFPKGPNTVVAAVQTPGKGKDKAQIPSFNPSDLVAIVKEPLQSAVRHEMSSVNLTYYDPSSSAESRPATAPQPTETMPVSPTPVRRTSALGPSRERPSVGERSTSASDIASASLKNREVDPTTSNAPKLFNIPVAEVAGMPAWSLVKDALPRVPDDMHYDLLHRIRTAKSFASSDADTQLMLEIRLLAIANLAHAYNESKFQEKIGTPDAEEPRRFHLAQQLSDLIQPSVTGQRSVTLQTETTVLLALEALSKCRHKSIEVAEALAISANHGVIYYELRKVVASLNNEEHKDVKMELRETAWREAVFDLINSLLQSNAQARHGEKMVAAGIMAILVEVLCLRTARARRFQERALQFLDSFIHGIPGTFANLANLKGLDAIADLTASSVDAALEGSRSGNGLPSQYKSKVVDYDIPYHLQSILRQVFKNTGHMFEHSAGTHDRLLRNLIDTPQILGALRMVIENAKIFGANVWSGAVNILSSFIHHEPTSYQVVGEAGLSKSFLEAVTGQETSDVAPSQPLEADYDAAKGPAFSIVDGILPVGEVMCDIPNGFGAICLNESGMQLFQASGALRKYLDIFLSPAHVRAMEDEGQTANTVGHSFDELARHHPRLKDEIMAAVVHMIVRVNQLCVDLAQHENCGTKLWERSGESFVIAGGQAALKGPSFSQREDAFQHKVQLMIPTTGPSVPDCNTETDRERAPAFPYVSACIKFLEGFFHNSSMCALFAEHNGAEILLDLATSPSNPYDLVLFPIFAKIAQVIKVLCESKPHLVLPNLIRRIQYAVAGLKVLTEKEDAESWFDDFVSESAPQRTSRPQEPDGTTVVKSLLSAHTLTHILGRTLAPPPYTLRHGQNNQLFSALNFTDVYVDLVETLSRLHSACLWEDLFVQSLLSEDSKIKSDPRAYVMRRIDANGIVEVSGEKSLSEPVSSDQNGTGSDNKVSEQSSREAILIGKNAKTVRYLLAQVPIGVEALFHSLGQAIVTKRSEPLTKQHAQMVADCLAKCTLWELDHRRAPSDAEALETKYVASLLNMIGRLLLKNSYSMESIGSKEALTMTLNKFYLAGGFDKLNDWLDGFVHLLAEQDEGEAVAGNPVRDAIHAILSFYDQVVNSRCINDASQSSAISNRERSSPDYFQSSQMLVEIRYAILPTITRIWKSKEINKFSESNLKIVVDILRLILKGEGEDRSVRRIEHAKRTLSKSAPEFKLRNLEGLAKLQEKSFDVTLCREAIYRCNNHFQNSEAYCSARQGNPKMPRFPVPEDEPMPSNSAGSRAVVPANDQASTGMETLDASVTDDSAHEHASPSIDDDMAESDEEPGSPAPAPTDDLNADIQAMSSGIDLADRSAPKAPSSESADRPFVTVDDLEDEREKLRTTLVDQCLEILSIQPSLTFDLADLIQAAVSKAGEAANPRADIGNTLISSLMSLQAEEQTKESAVKIQSCAHLVALILQDRDFFDSTIDELKDNCATLVSSVKTAAEQKIEDAPWIEMVLLIVERVLAEDEQPAEIKWTPPPSEDPLKSMPQAVLPERLVSDEFRSELLDALIEILPKIGKNTSLALSVLRVLVILTRNRSLATRVGQKSTMSRLFLMVRQLAGSGDDKLHSAFMLILRHIVEDDDTLRQIMRAEIKGSFENARPSRPMDTASYTRNLHQFVLRNPDIFVEVTKELVEIAKYDGHPHRGQQVVLKKPVAPVTKPVEPNRNQSSGASDGNTGAEVQKPSEPKLPAVETSDGVIQFLLRELSNYKELEDKPVQPTKALEPATTSNDAGPSDDVQMQDAGVANANPDDSSSSNKNTKPTFNPEDHVFYIYRCFLLQCLAELLASYNRTKVEFINFSRKPDTQPSTPSKPRSGTLNYLLNVLLPVGTLEHRDDVTHVKKMATSTWAIIVLVSLCARTNERHIHHASPMDTNSFAETEPELTFVRKFVLEHALRSFKEATVSAEPLDLRYSRLLALGDLFSRMLSGKTDLQRAPSVAASRVGYASQQQVGRLMYEKSFIGALTSAIAELDLNFPNAKRAVKYILSPMKQLTDLGVALSQNSDLSSSSGPGTSADEDEISSATSLSDEEEEEDREQTPDLFRGSSLGMFESGGAQDDESEEDTDEDEDDEMYDDGFEEEMEYAEDVAPEHGEVVSDEDDEDDAGLGEMGEVEGVPGDVAMGIDIRMQDDGDDTEGDDLTDDDEDDEDDDEDDDDDNHDEDMEFEDHLEEMTGDEENASMADDDEEGDWEDDGIDLVEAAAMDANGGSPHREALERIAHIIGAEDPSDPDDADGMVHLDMGAGEDEFFEDEMQPGDDDEDEDEGVFDDNVAYEPEPDDALDEYMDAVRETYAPQGSVNAIGIRGLPPQFHHHHHRHVLHNMLDMISEPMRSPFRTHRNAPAARDEDGVNPLLQRDGGVGGSNRDREALDAAGTRAGARRPIYTRDGQEFFQGLLQLQRSNGNGGVISVNVEPGQLPGLVNFPSIFTLQGRPGQHMLDLESTRTWREHLSMPRGWGDMLPGRTSDERGNLTSEEVNAVDFHPTPTTNRWQEEARMLFPGKMQEKATRIINALHSALVPLAMEAKRIRDKEERERKAAEEAAAAEEALKKAEAEKIEREAREQKEREEAEARQREEEAFRAHAEDNQSSNDEEVSVTETEGFEDEEPDSTAPAEPAAPAAERITINIRGRELDITNLGIDRDYLMELPEDFREEVIMTQFAEQRQQAAQSGEEPSEISREFLEALPREIQQELLRQEAEERRRRERAEARHRAAQQGTAAAGAAAASAQPEGMDNLDFMATLDPALRQTILIDAAGADDEGFAALPEAIQAEARALYGDRRMPRIDAGDRLGRGLDVPGARILNGQGPPGARELPGREVSRQRRPVVQMLDKPGVATLLRLMFVSLNQKAKNNLNGILTDVCKNSQNRAEVISILLSILQDGTADVNAVERSFAQLSLRAKGSSSGPKMPHTPKRMLSGYTPVSSTTELSPLNIVQQCLATLNALANGNPRVPSFFLNEHETITSQKAKTPKKGKSRDSKAAKFPLNALLTLLDRKLITENTAVMETLASLLNHVTHPLTILLRRAKEAEEAEKADADKPTEAGSDQRPQTSASDVAMGEAPAPATSTSEEDKGSKQAEAANAEPKKKHRDLTPPEVPEENIRLVVNILAARECASKTFTDTIDIIKNLSAIPGAKEIFGRELIRQAQDLGQTLLGDLAALSGQIDAADTGADLQGLALASFSSAGAKQRKLLRVLVALDHLFDPKRTPIVPSTTASTSGINQKLKDNILATLYESSTFDQLWSSLSLCLAAIRHHGNMVNVATILLPLIESLMVVCRNSALKEAPAIVASPIDTSIGTPPPSDARMDDLFFNFTEEHRKILNELIRNNPKLMNGNLAVLAKNSKVLEFDNKRSYFSRKLHDRRTEVRVSHPSLQLSVRRDQVFLDSFKSLYYKTGNEIKYGKLNIRFIGEEGIDAGGVSREWFAAMARQMFNGDYALFNPVASDRTTFHPNTLSEINPEHLMFFKFIGRIIGKALYEGRVLDCHFSRAVYRRILGKSVSLKDMESLDLDYYKSLVWILENDITDVTFETFSVDVFRFGVTDTVDLVPDGRNISVTEENKHEYVRLVVEYRLVKSVEEQLDNFLAGFHEIIPSELISIFNEQELELLISGLPEVDVDDWKNNTEYHNYQPTSPQIQWFWRAVRSFDKEERAKLLQFVTGTSKVPLNGFKELEGMNGFSKFNIHRDYSSKEKLPSSHTCFNQLDLPEYESYEHLRSQLYTAITAGSEYFGFA